MKCKQYLIVLALALVVFLPLRLFGEGVLCNEAYIEGFREEVAFGYAHLGETKAGSVFDTKLYVSAKGEYLYVQSNYLPLEYRFSSEQAFPSKASTSQALDLKLITFQLFKGDVDREIFDMAYDRMSVFIDHNLVKSSLFQRLDLGGVKSFTLVRGMEPVGKAKRLDLDTQEQKWVVEVGEHLFARIDSPGTPAIKSTFSDTNIDKESIFFLPLVEDKATKDEIAALIDPAMVLRLDPNAPTTWRDVLAQAKGRSIFVFGHMEGDSFVIENAAGQRTGSLKLPELERIAAECCGIAIFALGCNSASVTHKSGVNDEFNTVDMVQRFHLAQTSASDYWSFFTIMARDHGKYLEFVLDSALISGDLVNGKGLSGKIDIYKEEVLETDRSVFKSAGKIIFAGMPVPQGFSGSGDSEINPGPPTSGGIGCILFIIGVVIVTMVIAVVRHNVNQGKSI